VIVARVKECKHKIFKNNSLETKKTDSHTPCYAKSATSFNPMLGPGTYDPPNDNFNKIHKNMGILLKSKVPRLEPENKKKLKFPGPEKYNLNRELVDSSKWKRKSKYSSFAAEVKHGFSRDIGWVDKDKVKKTLELENQARVSVNGKWPKVDDIKNGKLPVVKPGPGEYEIEAAAKAISNYKPQSKKGNSSFLPGRKRFELEKDKVLNPGPGEYISKGTFNQDKYKVYGAVFMSESERDAF